MWSWLLHVLGVDDISGTWYAFWSGFGADLGEVALIGGVIQYARKINCHEPTCWRIGRFRAEDGPLVMCHRHHRPVVDELAARRVPDSQILDAIAAMQGSLDNIVELLSTQKRPAPRKGRAVPPPDDSA